MKRNPEVLCKEKYQRYLRSREIIKRLSLGMNQRQVANGMGISAQRISQILVKYRKDVGITSMPKIKPFPTRKPDKKKKVFIYFIKPLNMPGPIKIGKSHDPKQRLKVLSKSSPFPLEIIGSIQATHEDEFFLHRCFAPYHFHGEWFRPTRKVVTMINDAINFGMSHARENFKERIYRSNDIRNRQ